MSIRNPITKPSQMRRPIKWNPMNAEWKERLRTSEWWYSDVDPAVLEASTKAEKERFPKLFALRDKILSFGGEEVCMPIIEEDWDAIMTRGQFFYGDHAKSRKGQPCHCHSNAAYLWDANRGRCQIATGYALSEDGMWRQHSWVVQPLTLSWRVWETTVPRIAYFGVVFNDDECEAFLYSNG